MKKVKKVLELIQYNLTSLAGFELIFKTLSFLFFTPIFLKSFTWVMKVTGYKYITLENVLSFLLNPITIFLIIILILLMMIYAMFDITTLIVILDCSYQKKKIKVLDAMRISLEKCRKIFHLKNIPLAFLVLFLIPFLNIGISSSFIATVKIPEFIMDFILHNRLLLGIFCLVLFFLIFLLLKWIYSLHYFILEGVSFKEARKKSKKLSDKNHFKDIIALFLIQITLFVLYCFYIGISILLILLLNKVFQKWVLLKSITSTIILLNIAFSLILIALLSTPISYASISVLYYFHKIDKREKTLPLQIDMSSSEKKKTRNLKKIVIALTIISLGLGTIFTYGVYKGKYHLNIEFVRTLEITAHRGASVDYPENTMSAFIGAKEKGADWIELDVQQTKDGEIIVSHDTNLSRVTGVHKNIIDMDYSEIKDLDAGSFFDKKFKDEKIPLLKDVVDWAKNNHMKLNIELKPTFKEKDFEKEVVDIVKKYEYEDSCVITSQVYQVLENVKKYDKNIKTVYVMSLAVGDVVLLDKADSFSIEASNVNQYIVNKVHNAGKELYAWTVNKKESIQKMIDYNVDNIITDNIQVAKEIVLKSKTSNLINEFVQWVEKYLA